MNEGNMGNTVTIYSVPGPSQSEAILAEKIPGGWQYSIENLRFLSDLNPETEFEIVFGHVTSFGPVPKLPTINRITVHVYVFDELDLALGENPLPNLQHGAILNHILREHQLQTESYAVLDPDCYIIMPNAFDKLLSHMAARKLDIIGVSYPTTLPKVYYWDFPTAYFQLMRADGVHPQDLDFLPDSSSFVADEVQPGGAGLPTPKILTRLLKLSIISNLPIQRVLNSWRNQNRTSLIVAYSILFNLPYKNLPLFRDTGWSNRESFRRKGFQVLPHRIPRVELKNTIKVDEYLRLNLDVAKSGIDPRWHAVMHGILEGREMGKQPFVWSRLAKMLRPKKPRIHVFPATSIYAGRSIFESFDIGMDIGKMGLGYEYFWDSKPFCIHLGHGGKDDIERDILRLQKLRSLVTGNPEKEENSD
jgi:hypothetical protein